MPDMDLKARIENPAQPVILYEVIPPKLGDAQEMEQYLSLMSELAGKIDGVNIPEIREETRKGVRNARLPERIEPREFSKAIQSRTGIESVINRVTVHDAAAEQARWLKETYSDYGIRNLILVGGESHLAEYPGPSVPEAAALANEQGLNFLLGGITIPSRSQEADRIRKKYDRGLRFFTTQVLLDSNDIVDLIQGLNGLDVRIIMSFAPISDPKDIDFLRWLGVDVPQNVAWSLTHDADSHKAVEKSIANSAKILTDVFDHLPPHPPRLGLNIEQITRRNHEPARQMLDVLGGFYHRLCQTRPSSPAPLPQSTSR